MQGGRAGRGRPSPSSGRGRGGLARSNTTTSSPAVSSNSQQGQNSPAAGPSSQAAAGRIFTPEQWKFLAKFIGNIKVSDERMTGEFDFNLWIIDTGASRHVTCTASWLFNVHNTNCPVGLLNGKSVIATKEGSVHLTNNLILKNVLFVPELCCNLILVSQLIDDLHCTVQFTSHSCVIQDQSKELIGTSVRRDGLFYFAGVILLKE